MVKWQAFDFSQTTQIKIEKRRSPSGTIFLVNLRVLRVLVVKKRLPFSHIIHPTSAIPHPPSHPTRLYQTSPLIIPGNPEPGPDLLLHLLNMRDDPDNTVLLP